MSQPLPLTTSTFRDLIEGGYLYIDKTRYLYELVHDRKGVYFLSRPRRFGKSLMISTLAEIFQGDKELFRGLWLYESGYDWQAYPVIRIDFSAHTVKSAEMLERVIDFYLEEIAQKVGLSLRGFDYQSRFRSLITQLAQTNRQTNKIVILIDEYDKPLLDNIINLPEAQNILNTLKSFYTIIKAMDEYMRFVFITGISKFSRVGIFSGMNNPDDLTMDLRFATALGLTEAELRHYFQAHLLAFAQERGSTTEQLLDEIRFWYNGFRFVEGAEPVYNPYSTLQLFNKRRFGNYWFETGTPTFLIKLIKERNYDIQPFEALELPELGFSSYELESLPLVPLLFQTGYLTIKSVRRDDYGELYTLSYPNYEVKRSFLTYLLSAYNQIELTLSESHLRNLLTALHGHDLKQFFVVLDVFFANIDYDLQIAQEKYYQTIFYLIFLLLGVRVSAEVKTNQGRIDAAVELLDHIYLFEFKLDGSATEALKQIKDQAYAQKYRLRGKAITLVGANFDTNKRSVTDWKEEADKIVDQKAKPKRARRTTKSPRKTAPSVGRKNA